MIKTFVEWNIGPLLSSVTCTTFSYFHNHQFDALLGVFPQIEQIDPIWQGFYKVHIFKLLVKSLQKKNGKVPS